MSDAEHVNLGLSKLWSLARLRNAHHYNCFTTVSMHLVTVHCWEIMRNFQNTQIPRNCRRQLNTSPRLLKNSRSMRGQMLRFAVNDLRRIPLKVAETNQVCWHCTYNASMAQFYSITITTDAVSRTLNVHFKDGYYFNILQLNVWKHFIIYPSNKWHAVNLFNLVDYLPISAFHPTKWIASFLTRFTHSSGVPRLTSTCEGVDEISARSIKSAWITCAFVYVCAFQTSINISILFAI